MIYKSQYNALLPEPEVKEPIKKDFYVGSQWSYIQFKKEYYDSHVQAYNNWLSSQIPVVGNHSFQDGKSYQEEKDFITKMTMTKDATTNGIDFYGVEQYEKVAIPIKEGEDYVVSSGNTDETVVASHSSTATNNSAND